MNNRIFKLLARRIVGISVSVAAALCIVAAAVTGAAADDLSDSTPSIDTSQTKYAVIIGIDKYRHYPHLNHSVADANLLAQRFEDLGYIVKVLRDYEADVDIIFDNLYRIGNLLDASAGRDAGTVVFAFSGHGFQQDGENFLATAKSDPADLRRTSLPVAELKRVLMKSDIARKLVFIDACRNMPTRAFPIENNTF
ncbi:MAG: caspase family protein, partial [Pseudomonadota bacterium]